MKIYGHIVLASEFKPVQTLQATQHYNSVDFDRALLAMLYLYFCKANPTPRPQHILHAKILMQASILLCWLDLNHTRSRPTEHRTQNSPWRFQQHHYLQSCYIVSVWMHSADTVDLHFKLWYKSEKITTALWHFMHFLCWQAECRHSNELNCSASELTWSCVTRLLD